MSHALRALAFGTALAGACLAACAASVTGVDASTPTADAGVPAADIGADAVMTVGTCSQSNSDAAFDAPPAPTGGPERIAMLDHGPMWVGIVGDQVYFALYSVGIEVTTSTGGALPTVLVPATDSTGLYVSNGFAFDDTYLYWIEGLLSHRINRVPRSGGATQMIASSARNITGIAVDGGNVYWVDQDAGTINRVAASGGTSSVLASGLTQPAAIVIRCSTIYVTNAASDLLSMPESGGSVTTLAHGSGLPPNTQVAAFSPGVAADGTNVYYSDYYAMDPVVLKVPLGGGSPVVLAHSRAYGIAVDATNVYWVEGGGGASTVNAVPIAGGAVRVIASSVFVPAGPAFDANSLYWGTTRSDMTCGHCPPPMGINAVMRAAK